MDNNVLGATRDVRRLRGEQSRITVRLPLVERREAERAARSAGTRLSDFVRQAIREKISRERREDQAEDSE